MNMEQGNNKKLGMNIMIFVIMIIIVTFRGTFAENTSVSVTTFEGGICITAPNDYELKLPYEEIDTVEYTETMDFGEVLTGGAFDGYQLGTYRNSAYGVYNLAVNDKVSSYIVVAKTDGSYVVFNFETDKATEALVDALHDVLAQ